jgi:hypothetical protein
MGIQHRLIPIFSDVIEPDPEMTALVDETRAPFAEEMSEVIGTAGHAPVPARQFQRHLGRPDLRRADQPARRRDRAVARLPLGRGLSCRGRRSRARTSTTSPR